MDSVGERKTLGAVGRELALFGAFLLVTIALTWPLAIRLSTATSDLGDPLLNTWILDWDLYAASQSPAHLYDAPIFYPAKMPLAFSENLFGIAIAALPFFLLGFGPLAVYNLALILGFAFCGYGASVLARVVSGSTGAAFVVGILYAFTQFRLDHLAHLQLIWGGWLPLILASIIAYWRRPSWKLALCFGGALLMNGLSNVHLLLFAGIAAPVSLAVLALAGPRRDWRFWMRIAIAGGVAVLLLVPVLLPYQTVARLYGMHRSEGEAMWGSADWTDWLMASDRSATYGALSQGRSQPERCLFPGMLPLFLTIAGIVLYRKPQSTEDPPIHAPRFVNRWLLRVLDAAIVAAAVVSYGGAVAKKFDLRMFHVRLVSVDRADLPMIALIVLIAIRLSLQLPLAWTGDRPVSLRWWVARGRWPVEFSAIAVWIAVGVLGSLGLKAFFYEFLYHHVTPFQSIRVPARFAVIAYTGLIGSGALGAAELLRRRRSWYRPATLALLLVATFVDIRPILRWEHAIETPDDSDLWLRDAPFRGAALELPVDRDVEFTYLLGATIHHRPIFNGTSGFEPPVHARIHELSITPVIGPELIALLESNGGSLLVVHDDWLRTTAAATHAWLARELALGRIAFIRRLDHRVGGTYLFAITRNFPGWRSLKPPDRLDGAGFSPAVVLDRMLHDQPVYIARTFGVLERPFDGNIAGPLTVSGWALSPHGIRGVDVLLENGTRRYPAIPFLRPDVHAHFPWYASTPAPGFFFALPRRPHGVKRETDVQVEIIDGRGGRTRLPDLPVQW